MRASTAFSILAAAASVAAAPHTFEVRNATLGKRDFENVPFTWFDVGVGACGGVNQPNEYVSASHSSSSHGMLTHQSRSSR